jgi:hypothetical protein
MRQTTTIVSVVKIRPPTRVQPAESQMTGPPHHKHIPTPIYRYTGSPHHLPRVPPEIRAPQKLRLLPENLAIKASEGIKTIVSVVKIRPPTRVHQRKARLDVVHPTTNTFPLPSTATLEAYVLILPPKYVPHCKTGSITSVFSPTSGTPDTSYPTSTTFTSPSCRSDSTRYLTPTRSLP